MKISENNHRKPLKTIEKPMEINETERRGTMCKIPAGEPARFGKDSLRKSLIWNSQELLGSDRAPGLRSVRFGLDFLSKSLVWNPQELMG